MRTYDTLVLGAGLAGMSAARDLLAGGADVIVLEARERAGGRVTGDRLSDGRVVQLGGEIIGTFHTAYKQLAEELGLTVITRDEGGDEVWVLNDTCVTGEGFFWLNESDRKLYDELESKFTALCATVNPDDPWSHPNAEELDRTSFGQWLRAEGATAEVVRAIAMRHRALAEEHPDRVSLLGYLRKEAVAGGHAFYDYAVWENERIKEGSTELPRRLSSELGASIRYNSIVTAIDLTLPIPEVTLRNGEVFTARTILCALPVGPLRDVKILGLSPERLRSLHAQLHAPAAKVVAVYDRPFWQESDLGGSASLESGIVGGFWDQGNGVLSGLIPPESIGAFLATPKQRLRETIIDELGQAFGHAGAKPEDVYIRDWFADPFTQGYVSAWRPGDVMEVGPLHGTHEPPFYVCGSDHWVAGYMEGAVRTGRTAAKEILSGLSNE